jgi:hypothetical protein
MDLLTNKEIVKELLVKFERCRNSDNILIANVWSNHLRKTGRDIKTMSASDIFLILSNGDLPNTESIRRARAKFQEENVSLRGSNYKGRLSEEEKIEKQLREENWANEFKNK